LPRLEQPAASSAPRSRVCPPGSSSPTSPLVPPECSVSSTDDPSALYVPADAADPSESAAVASVDDGAAWIPSAACARGTRGNWPESSWPPCWPSSRRRLPSGSAT